MDEPTPVEGSSSAIAFKKESSATPGEAGGTSVSEMKEKLIALAGMCRRTVVFKICL